jgi:hypothetical protein
MVKYAYMVMYFMISIEYLHEIGDCMHLDMEIAWY